MVVDGDTYVGADIKNYFALLYLTDSEEMDLPKKKRFRGNGGWRHVCFSYNTQSQVDSIAETKTQ